ncbi:MAG: hypothetical protein WAT39_23005 [Planctomycetota bacterium]
MRRTKPVAQPVGRERSHAAALAWASLFVASTVIAWLIWGDAASPAVQTTKAPVRAAAAAPVATSEAPAVAAARELATAGPAVEQALLLCTFLDGEPVPSLVEDTTTVWSRVPDWDSAVARHRLPVAGEALAVLSRDCVAAVVRRNELPVAGEHRVDLRRSPILDVRLVNVPAGIRDRLELKLQLEYGQLEPAMQRATLGTGRRQPVLMADDRALVPLVVSEPGRVVVHARSRHSTHSYPTAKTAFEPVSQVIEIDCSVLAPACSLAGLTLTLRFPYAHPSGELDLDLHDAEGSSMMFQRRQRGGARELRYTFRDLPRAIVQPVLTLPGAAPCIYLAPIDLNGGGGDLVRDVVAESSLRVVLTGHEGLAESGVRVLLRLACGSVHSAAGLHGNDARFEHLHAGRFYAQAVAHDDRRCSPVVPVDVGVAAAHELALQLVPAGEIAIAAAAFDMAAHVEAHQVGQPPSRLGLHRVRTTLLWLPVGEARIEWASGSRTLRVEPGVLNRW